MSEWEGILSVKGGKNKGKVEKWKDKMCQVIILLEEFMVFKMYTHETTKELSQM